MAELEYPFTMRRLSDEEGGGYLIEFPDLPGCMSDGETPEEAIQNGADALHCWIAAMHEAGRPVPPPPTRNPMFFRFSAIGLRLSAFGLRFLRGLVESFRIRVR